MTSAITEQAPQSFAFGPFVLIPEQQRLLECGTPVRIGGRALDILTVLVNRAGELVSKHELLARVWPTTVVEESNLKVNMVALRRVLGDGADAARYIATVNGRGYQFIAPVRPSGSPGLMLARLAVERRSHNLPTRSTRIFGTSDVIDAIRSELEASRLVSIVGLGGIGKTMVALAVAEHAVGSFRDGVWLVDLALLKDPDLVPNAIARAIGLAANSAGTLTALCDALRGREMLLVLDSCECVIDAAASCTNRVLAECAGVKILVTSYEPLLVSGERVRRLSGLATLFCSNFLNAKEAVTFPAIELFAERAT